jgi:hypothetical protein
MSRREALTGHEHLVRAVVCGLLEPDHEPPFQRLEHTL